VKLPHPKLPHPNLSRPLRRPSAASSAEGLSGSPSLRAASAATEEDARILRRTRLRLMAVSGVVTLLILVVLGAATYRVVSSAQDESDRTTLRQYADSHPVLHVSYAGPETAELGGEGIFAIYVSPDGKPIPPKYQTLPDGLPDTASLNAAMANLTRPDQRFYTAPDGTSYQVMTVQYQAVGPNATPGTWLIQFVQNRTAEVRLINKLLLILLGGGAAALLASLLAGYLYAGRALVPIRQSIDRRQAALQRQREFTANASHELRTPLTVIRTSIEDLRRNRRSRVEDVGEALEDIEAEVRTVTALVEDMLLLARTDSGVIQLERAPLDLADVALDSSSLLASLGTERGVAVLVEPLPAQIAGDEMRLRQLVTILVDNAIRHSPSGSTVEVRVRPERDAAVLEVQDHGPGIKPEDMPRLWERFWRADNAPAGGTGLGLAIAKWIVDQHGGKIGASNCDEGGAMFWVRLPAPGVQDFDSLATEESEMAAAPDLDPAPPGSPHWLPTDPNERLS
jgi:two-component system, OmpR family, sensor histidine kinase CiaH